MSQFLDRDELFFIMGMYSISLALSNVEKNTEQYELQKGLDYKMDELLQRLENIERGLNNGNLRD